MKKFWKVLVLASFLGLLGGTANAADYGSKEEAVGMVQKAIAYMKVNGKEKALAEISNTTGRFVDRDLYVVVFDMHGRNLAHGANPRMVGKDLIDIKDADGKPYMKERIEIIKTKGKGWQDYKFTNPVSKQIEPKTMYVEKYEDLIFGCGVYKK